MKKVAREPRKTRREFRSRAAAAPAAPEGDARVAMLTPIPGLLRECRCDPGPVFARAGLDLAMLDQPESRVTFGQGGRLLEACVAATGIPHFGLLIGTRFDLSMLGILGQLMRSCDSVRTALHQLVRHLHLNDRGAVGFMVDLSGEQIALGYAIYRSDTPGIDQIYDLAMANAVGIMRGLCGASWKPTRVSFAHRPPQDLTPYKRYFRAPLHFDAAHSEVIVSSRWLDKPLAEADLPRRVAAERHALAAERGDDGRLVERVRQAAQSLVMTGEATSRHVAAALGVNQRVLRRRLQMAGTSVHQLIGAARVESACQLLRATHLTLAEVGAALGYSDATAFSRAFRNWTQSTPGAWRSRAQAPTRTVNVATRESATPARRRSRSA